VTLSRILKDIEDREVKQEQRTVAGRRRLTLKSLAARPRAYAAALLCSLEEASAPGWRPPAGFFEAESEAEREEFGKTHQPAAIFKPEPGRIVVVFRGEDPRKANEPRKGKG